ncbi:transketolase [Peptococcus simiae]|uniref:transketolase n=1 Tax=Peptococcus simiae TaxID=1643805 RepID=UPI00397F3AAD
MSKLQMEELEAHAGEIRSDILRMIAQAGSGHPGGSLSAIECLTYLYFHAMNIDPQNPDMPDRDRFVLSKGHAAPVLYATLAHRGFFPVADLMSLRQLGSKLQGHPDMRKVPGVEMSTGSLGTGFSTAIGMALAARLDGSDRRTFVLLGDGELDEGQVWEAAMAASHYRLGRLIAFADVNGLQIDGFTKDVMNPEPVDAKFAAFGWDVQVVDGHNFQAIHDAVEGASAQPGDRPHMIVLRTIKGHGISFMENECKWHGTAPSEEELARALEECLKGDK